MSSEERSELDMMLDEMAPEDAIRVLDRHIQIMKELIALHERRKERYKQKI